MKKKYHILFLLLTGSIVLAQPVLTAADFSNFSMTGHSLTDFTGITPGNAGANQTWDFSGISTASSTSSYLMTVPFNTAPGFLNFPLANHCQKQLSIGSTIWFYFFSKLTSSGLEYLGATNEQGIVAFQFSNTSYIPLPLSYTDTYTDTYQITTQTNPVIINHSYDAFGTLITPYGTFTNIGRQKAVYTTDNYTYYQWFQTNPLNTLFEIRIDNTTNLVTSATIYDAVLAVNSYKSNDTISVFPNPTRDMVNIQPLNHVSIDKIIITDLAGKIVLEQTQNSTQVNVEPLASGLYIIEVVSGEEVFVSKFMKI